MEAVKNELKDLKSRRTLEELKESIAGLEEEDKRLGDDLEGRQSGDVTVIK